MTKSISNIYTYNRPIKEAFIVNSDDPNILKQLELIIDYCHKIWGGRYNQIIELNNNKINEVYFNNLKVFDPDVIRTFIDLPENVILKFEEELSVESIQKVEYNDFRLDIRSYHGALLKPIPQYTPWSKILRPYALFRINDYKFDPLLKRFLLVNFGIYDNMLNTENLYMDIEKDFFEISSEEDFINNLKKVAPFKFKPYYFQSQLCSETDTFENIKSEDNYNSYIFFIGKTPKDLIYFWNLNLVLPNDLRNQLSACYIPYEFIENKEYRDFTKKVFFNKNIFLGDNLRNGARFFSTSIKQEEIRDILLTLMPDKYLYRSYKFLNKPFRLKYNDNHKFEELSFLDKNTLIGQNTEIRIAKPDNKFTEYLYGDWITEFYIPANNENYNKTYYYKLPKSRYLASRLFPGYSRINREGMPTVLINSENPNIEFNLLNKKYIFRTLLIPIPKNCLFSSNDLRKNIIKNNNEEITDIGTSDKGIYLEGFINIFGGLDQLESFLGDLFFIDIFKQLSGQNNKNIEKDIKNALMKKLNPINDNEFMKSAHGLEYLSKLIINTSKKLKSTDKTIDYNYLIKEAKKRYSSYINSQEYLNESTSISPKERYLFSEGELKEKLKKLVDLNILQMGLNLKCNSCGLKNWHHVDNIGRIIICPGCLNKFTLDPEVKWRYKLNSLVKDGFSNHGLTAVALTLEYLLRRSHDSFFYIPSIDIYLNSNKDTFSDLDIVCISDGKLIIGEVKQSQSLFKAQDFIKMLRMAQIIKPDRVIFSALDLNIKNTPSKFLQDQIKEMRDKLISLNIEVGLIPLDQLYTSDFVEWFDENDYSEEIIRKEAYYLYQKRNNQTSNDDWREAEKKVLKKEMDAFYRKFYDIKF